MVLLIVAGAAFAQIPDGFSVGGWGRADFVPFQGVFPDGGDAKYYTGTGSGWGDAYTGLSFKFNQADGRISGEMDLGAGSSQSNSAADWAGKPGIGDNLFIATKPFGTDILYLLVGKTRDGRFRGPGTDGNFQGFIGGPGKDGDAVFNRFEPNGGALFISQPVTGLSIYAQLDPGAGTITGTGAGLGDGVEANDVYKKIQTGFAYDISGIGLARAQYVGNTGKVTLSGGHYTWAPARIEAAFKLTAVPGLNLDFGLKLPLPAKGDVGTYEATIQDNFQVAVAGSYTSGDFAVTYGLYGGFGGSLATDVPGSTRLDMNPTFNLILVPSFYVAAIDAKLGVDLGFKVVGEGDFIVASVGNESTTFGVGAWAERNLGKGSIKAGLAYQFPPYTGTNGTVNQTGVLSVPVILEISF
jgi:hypothetical protein